MAALCGLLAVLVAALVAPCAASSRFRPGEVVSTVHRSQYRGYRTSWTETLAHDAPRFAHDTSVSLNPANAAKEYTAEEEFKVAFAFDHETFLSPWITVTDGHGAFLNFVRFDFTYAGDRILSIATQTDYVRHENGAVNAGARPTHITLRYHWHAQEEQDVSFGMAFLLFAGVATAFGSAAAVLIAFDPAKRRAAAGGLAKGH